jgi:hypothetical protein
MTLESWKKQLDMDKINDREWYIDCIQWWLITSDWVVFNNGIINQMVWLNHAKNFEKQHFVALDRSIHKVEKLLFNKTESTVKDWESVWLQANNRIKRAKIYNKKQKIISQTTTWVAENLQYPANKVTLSKRSIKKRKTTRPIDTMQTSVEQLLQQWEHEKVTKKALYQEYGSDLDLYIQKCYETYVTQIKTPQEQSYLSFVTQKIHTLKNAQKNRNKSIVATRELYKDIAPLIKMFVDTIRAHICYHENIANRSLATLFNVFFDKTIIQEWLDNPLTGEKSMIKEKITLQEDILEQDYLPKVLKWLIEDIIKRKNTPDNHDEIDLITITQEVEEYTINEQHTTLTTKTPKRNLSLKQSDLLLLWITYYKDICVLQKQLTTKEINECKNQLLIHIKNNKLNYFTFSQSLRWSKAWWYSQQINKWKEEAFWINPDNKKL